MTPRSTQILEAAIESFIQSGEPVSSGRLYDDYDFGIKPAMIRLELDALEEAGYLGQPYHSAGRVPTDAGYEFFARRILDLSPEPQESSSMNDRALSGALPDFLNELSAQLGILSIAADLAHDLVYKAGLVSLVNNLDWQDRDEIRSVIRDFEEVDGRLPGASKKLSAAPQVFIGKKSPVTRSETLSVVGEIHTIDGAQISIFAIGPKRMDYRKVIRIFRNL